MTEAYARKLKRWNLIALTGTLLFLVLLTAGAFWLWCRVFGPPEALPLLTPQAAAEQLDLGATALWDTASYTGGFRPGHPAPHRPVDRHLSLSR